MVKKRTDTAVADEHKLELRSVWIRSSLKREALDAARGEKRARERERTRDITIERRGFGAK